MRDVEVWVDGTGVDGSRSFEICVRVVVIAGHSEELALKREEVRGWIDEI